MQRRPTTSRVRGGCVALLLLAGCTVKSDEDKSTVGTTTQQAALALAKGVTFEGGEPREGLLPEVTAPKVTLLDDSSSGVLLITPGEADVNVLFGFDNPDEAGNPVTTTLLQFEGADEHVAVARDRSAASEATLQFSFSVKSDVCDELCNSKYELTLLRAVELEDGKVSKHKALTLTLDCRTDGDPGRCSKKSDSTAGSGASASAQAIGADFAEKFAVLDKAECACPELPDFSCDRAPASQADIATLEECLVSAAQDDEAVASWLACASEWLDEVGACYAAAECNDSAMKACIPSSHVDAGSTDGHGGPPDELVAKCGAYEGAISVALDPCLGKVSSGDLDGGKVQPQGGACAAIPLDTPLSDYSEAEAADACLCGYEQTGTPQKTILKLECLGRAVFSEATVADCNVAVTACEAAQGTVCDGAEQLGFVQNCIGTYAELQPCFEETFAWQLALSCDDVVPGADPCAMPNYPACLKEKCGACTGDAVAP